MVFKHHIYFWFLRCHTDRSLLVVCKTYSKIVDSSGSDCENHILHSTSCVHQIFWERNFSLVTLRRYHIQRASDRNQNAYETIVNRSKMLKKGVVHLITRTRKILRERGGIFENKLYFFFYCLIIFYSSTHFIKLNFTFSFMSSI